MHKRTYFAMTYLTKEQAEHARQIALRIDGLIASAGLKKADFSNKSGISTATLSQWRSGLYYPSQKKLAAASKCLDVSVAYLEYGDDSAQQEKPTAQGDGLSEFTEKEAAILKWFRSLPEEKRRAILIAQDAPKELLD